MNPQFVVHQSSEPLVRAVAEQLVTVAQDAFSRRGRFLLSLAGGSTPKALYKLLATDEFRLRMPWQSTLILFGDERAISSVDELSNYHMARTTLLDAVPVPPQNVFRMHGDSADLEEAAKEYGLLIQELGTTLDVCLLGMGPDGHTASLFPHSPALHENKHRCVATPPASLPPHIPRLTMTYRTINAARHVWLLVTGDDKAERLNKVLCGEKNIEEMPVQGVAPENGELIWWLDSAAAAQLPSTLIRG